MAFLTFFTAPIMLIVLTRLSLAGKINLPVSTAIGIAYGIVLIMAIIAQCTSEPYQPGTCVPFPFVEFFGVIFFDVILVTPIAIIAAVTEQKKQEAAKSA